MQDTVTAHDEAVLAFLRAEQLRERAAAAAQQAGAARAN
jgi:hypothetical protein